MQEPAHILQNTDNKLDIITIEIIYQVLNAIHRFFSIDNFEFGKFTNIFHYSTFLIIANKIS